MLASLHKSLDLNKRKKVGLAKKIHIKVKRGKPDGVTRYMGEEMAREAGTGKGEKATEIEGQRDTRRVCAFYSSSRIQAPP